MTDFDHRFWPDRAFLGNPCAGPSCENDHFHDAFLPIVHCFPRNATGRDFLQPFGQCRCPDKRDGEKRALCLQTFPHGA